MTVDDSNLATRRVSPRSHLPTQRLKIGSGGGGEWGLGYFGELSGGTRVHYSPSQNGSLTKLVLLTRVVKNVLREATVSATLSVSAQKEILFGVTGFTVR